MKKSSIAIATVSIAALALAGCGAKKEAAGVVDNSTLKICMVTDGDGGAFWTLAKAGAVRAGEDLGVSFDYQEANNDSAKQASLIEADIASGCNAIAVTATDSEAIKKAMAKATAAKVSLITMTTGAAASKDLGAFTHIGQDSRASAQQAGIHFRDAGLSRVLCPIHDKGSAALKAYCDGLADILGKPNVIYLQIKGGATDTNVVQLAITRALRADTTIKGVLALTPEIATVAAVPAIAAVGRDVAIGTVDSSTEAVQAVADGKLLFAMDQQPFAQGHLAVEVLYLSLVNSAHVGVGQTIYSGPGFITKDNVAKVQELATSGVR